LERELGVAQGDLRPDAEADAERAERLRVARQVQQARAAGVFFQIAGRRDDASLAGTPRTAAAVPAPQGTTASPGVTADRQRDPSAQGRKVDFLESRVETGVLNRHALQYPVSADTVFAGTVIAASLVTGINSDLPGFVIAQVTENVFDTVSGRRLLIPQGTKLIGKYDSVISFGQRRALVVWNRLILPDGSSIMVDNLPATDAAGYAGLEDEVDFHTWQLVKGAALSTLLGIGAEVGAGSSDSDSLSAARESVQQNAARIGQQFTERNLDVQPTIAIRAGWPLRVVVHKDLVLREYKP
jgi:type IV secretion system protein VirB10